MSQRSNTIIEERLLTLTDEEDKPGIHSLLPGCDSIDFLLSGAILEAILGRFFELPV